MKNNKELLPIEALRLAEKRAEVFNKILGLAEMADLHVSRIFLGANCPTCGSVRVSLSDKGKLHRHKNFVLDKWCDNRDPGQNAILRGVVISEE